MSENQRHLVTQREFDRLAAGDLDIDESRRIVESLDEVPDGWKRCALALLEAQSWRRTFRGLISDDEKHPAAVTTRVSKSRVERPTPWRMVGTASLLVFALCGGISLGRYSAGNSGTSTISNVGGQTVSPGSIAAAREDATTSRQVTEPDRPSQDLIGLFKLDGESGPERVVSVVYDANADRDGQQPPLLTEYEQHLLALNGWQISQDRKLLTVQLADGGKLTFPIDEIRYRSIQPQIY